MFNPPSIAAVDGATFLDQWQRPLYNSYSFGQIPASIGRLLGQGSPHGLPADVFGPQGYPPVRRVVVVLMDALGWNLFERAAAAQVIGVTRLVNDGVVSKLSTLFPSTTTAHVHCLNTGLLPCQSHLFEWRQYWPALDQIISPLIFSKGEDAGGQVTMRPNTLVEAGVDPGVVLQPSPFHQLLADGDVDILEYLPAAYAHSTYNATVNAMAQRRGYDTVEAGLHDLATVLAAPTDRQYVRFYIPDIDSLSHQHGWDSEMVWSRLKALFLALENTIFRGTSQRGETAILLTADHGQIVSDPAATLYLDEAIPELMPMLAPNRQGAPLFPCGSNRDVFLQVQPAWVDAAFDLLQRKLAGFATVLRTAEVADVLFGPDCSQDFLAVTGQILVLPEGKSTVFLAGPGGRYKGEYQGTHGGLTRAEAQIPLAYLRV